MTSTWSMIFLVFSWSLSLSSRICPAKTLHKATASLLLETLGSVFSKNVMASCLSSNWTITWANISTRDKGFILEWEILFFFSSNSPTAEITQEVRLCSTIKTRSNRDCRTYLLSKVDKKFLYNCTKLSAFCSAGCLTKTSNFNVSWCQSLQVTQEPSVTTTIINVPSVY